MPKPLRVLVVGCGHMGASHARAYRDLPGFELCGLVARTADRRAKLAAQVGNPPEFDDYAAALKATKPDVVSINTYPDTHAKYAKMALEAGAHLFMEKPIAETVKEAESIVKLATKLKKKLVIGYILRVHPSWKKFTKIAQTLGKPLVMRLDHGPRTELRVRAADHLIGGLQQLIILAVMLPIRLGHPPGGGLLRLQLFKALLLLAR